MAPHAVNTLLASTISSLHYVHYILILIKGNVKSYFPKESTVRR